VRQRETEREIETERERQRERVRQRETETETERQRETGRERGQTETEREVRSERIFPLLRLLVGVYNRVIFRASPLQLSPYGGTKRRRRRVVGDGPLLNSDDKTRQERD
jgi:hypothetical protein